MSHYHCVVWIDHKEAHVIHFNPDDAEKSIVHPKSKHKTHLHHKDGVIGPGKSLPDNKYYQEVADAITDAGEILIVGPSTAKLELFKYLQADLRRAAAIRPFVGMTPAGHQRRCSRYRDVSKDTGSPLSRG